MSTPFQNRLVGTIIVAALAVIILPDILDGDKKTYQQEFEPIPTAPAINSSANKPSFPVQKLEQLPSEQLADDVAIDDLKTLFTEDSSDSNTALTNDTVVGIREVYSDSSDTIKINKVNKPAAFSERDNTAAKPNSNNKKSNNITTSGMAKTSQVSNTSLPERAIAGQAWVVQLGSFRHKNNVKELVEKLQTNGYTVFTKPITTKNGTLTKVFVGPELIKSSLEKKLLSLNKLTGVKGKISRFKSTKK